MATCGTNEGVKSVDCNICSAKRDRRVRLGHSVTYNPPPLKVVIRLAGRKPQARWRRRRGLRQVPMRMD